MLLDYFKPITSEELDELVVILRSALQKAEDTTGTLARAGFAVTTRHPSAPPEEG